MHVTLVHVRVKREHVAGFAAATRANHEGSLREPGNLRFDVLQLREDPARFVLYEVFRSEADAKAHKETPHYRAWRDLVAGWMEAPREGVSYDAIYPEDPARW